MAEAKHMAPEGLRKKQMKLLPDKRTLTLIFIVCASCARGVCAVAETAIPIRPEPVGSGARALGQSAFIAVADDATAASWNPAGLINLEKPEASFVGAWRTVAKDYSVAVGDLWVDQDCWSESQINFMSYVQPLQLFGNTDVVLSVNYHQVYDFGVEYNGSATGDFPPLGTVQWKINGKSEGAVSAYALAGGLSLPSHPEITIGAGFNWYTRSLLNNYTWQNKETDKITIGSAVIERTYTETFDDFRAHNFTFGLLWDVYEKRENLLTLGLVYHTPFTAKVDRKLDKTSTTGWESWPKESMDIDFPPSFGAGANYRFSDRFSAAFDVEWKEWSKFKQKYADGTSISLVDDDTLAYRLGAEYLNFFEGASESVLAYRGGVFYEPRPEATHRDTIPIYGFSLGLGWTLREQFSLDFAYQFRWGEKDLEDIDYRIEEQFFVVSVIKYL